MCFSATASFSAGVVLTVIGIASIKKTHHKSQLLFASIPLIFGVQQISEGVLWLTISNPDYFNIQNIFTHIYLFVAQIVWPIWVPLALLLLEKNETRKNIQRVLVGAGLLVGVYLSYCLIMFTVESEIVGYHIKYVQDYPSYFLYYGITLYILATVVPTFFSHIKRMWILGITIIISYIISAIFFQFYILSVWCFFSSIISISIYLIMSKIEKIESYYNLTIINRYS
jgi:hypothetical protein